MLYSPLKRFHFTSPCRFFRGNRTFLSNYSARATVAVRLAMVATCLAIIAGAQKMIATALAMVATRLATIAKALGYAATAPASVARAFLIIARVLSMMATRLVMVARHLLKAPMPLFNPIFQDFHLFFNRFASACTISGGARHKTISYGKKVFPAGR